MQNLLLSPSRLLLLVGIFSACTAFAQQAPIQYFRPWDQRGINVFEPSKTAEQPAFDSIKIRLGASFTQNFQALTHENEAVYFAESPTNSWNKNRLFGSGTGTDGDTTKASLTGFSTAMANMNLDVQLADGIRLNVETYMSTRHHPEFWVKGGYLQIDKLPMFGNPQWFADHVRLKMGEFVPNFGDMQFRRSDAGNCIYNPFVENYILDAFTTEIGGEVYIFPTDNVMLMAGITNGQVHGEVTPYSDQTPPGFQTPFQRKPSIFFKAAYDKTVGDLRYRLSASHYSNGGSPITSLYLGDRGGSHYSMVMEQQRSLLIVDGIPTDIGLSTTSNNKDSGRFIPLFQHEVSSLMINPFIKYKGLEFFGTYEVAQGRMNFEPVEKRKITQMAAEVIYRLGAREQLYVAGRYNTITGKQLFQQNEFTINRMTLVGGWFPTRNILIKLEYVNQEYLDFTPFDYQYNGKFSGFTAQAVVGF
jgi:hypothetical protein